MLAALAAVFVGLLSNLLKGVIDNGCQHLADQLFCAACPSVCGGARNAKFHGKFLQLYALSTNEPLAGKTVQVQRLTAVPCFSCHVVVAE